MRFVRLLVLPALLGAACTGEELSMRVVEGSGAVVPRASVSARRLSVEVTRNGRPVAGVAVTFRMPAGEVTGRFASGFSNEMMLTGADGRAAVYGIRWGDAPGRTEVSVTAVNAGERAEVSIPVEVSASAREGRADRNSGESVKSPGSAGRKWLIIAGVAGGALAGLALAGGGGSSIAPVAVVQPAIVTPTIGAPTIVIGRPQ